MNARFVLDEWSWMGATGTDHDVLSNAVDRLLERLDVVRERNEGVVRHQDYYWTDLGDGVQLYSVLFEPNCALKFDRDLTERLSLALDRVIAFDDSNLSDYDAEFCGGIQFTPGVAWAHACCSAQHQAAILPLSLAGVPSGKVAVVIGGVTNEIFFVTEELQHVNFFRSIIDLENANEAMFECLAPSAFPALEWADNVWRGLGDFDRPYIAVRDELVRYLGGLNDHGASCFHELRAGDPRHLQRVVSAQVGTETSDEDGETKQNRASREDRTRRHRGENKVFWWHVKLQPHIDRIYFLYEPPSKDLPVPVLGRIVVGRFKDHCI